MTSGNVPVPLSKRRESMLTDEYGGSCIIDGSINHRRYAECDDDDDFEHEIDLFEERTLAGRRRCKADERL